MREVIILLVVLYTCLSVPVHNANFSYKVELENQNITYESDLVHKNYSYRVETSDGTVRYEKGHLENNSLVVEGSYEYTSDNFKYNVTYLADKNGYQPRVLFDMKIDPDDDKKDRTTTEKMTTKKEDKTTEKTTSTAKPKSKN